MSPDQLLLAFRRLALVLTLIALVAVVVGAWVRLTAAGLGCPDWPGCYGHLHPSGAAAELHSLAVTPGHPFDYGKALREMQHRYIAMSLGLGILALLALALANRRDPRQPLKLPVAIVPVVIAQALLGKYTVTWLVNPTIVSLHLLGGLTTLALLAWLAFPGARDEEPALRRFAVLGLLVLAAQITLGGWTSSNYAATACPDFPSCGASAWPATDFGEGFKPWRGLERDYEGGVLSLPARAAIHETHRIGALLTALVLLALSFGTLARARGRAPRLAAALVLGALLLQWLIGVNFIWQGFPLALGVLHNLGAALLLLAVLALTKSLGLKGGRATLLRPTGGNG
jgi:heme a synthase